MKKPFLYQFLPAFVIFATTMGIFWPVLQSEFLTWDDNIYIAEPRLQGISPSHIAAMFRLYILSHYTPITWMTYGLDYVLWGPGPWGYHFTNLLTHGLMTGALYILALELLCLAQRKKPIEANLSLCLGAAFAALILAFSK